MFRFWLARGVIVFALCWAILLAVPSLRFQNVRAWYADLSSPEVYWGSGPNSEQLESAYRRSPNDPFLAGQHLQYQWLLSQRANTAQFFGDYDALVARFPDRLDLRRQRLVKATIGNIVPSRYTDWFENGAPGQNPPPDDAVSGKWLSAKQLEKVVASARAGAALAPDDAFFPWMEALALWGLRREAQAIAALERAGNCARFDDGIVSEARQNLVFAQRNQRLEWIEKLSTALGVVLPHYAIMRNLAREVTLSGVAQYRAGNKTEAWRRWQIALRAGRAFRVGQLNGKDGLIVGFLAGQGIEESVWRTIAREIGGLQSTAQLEGTQVAPSERVAQVFDRVARRDGQVPLANWSAKERAQMQAFNADPHFRPDYITRTWFTPRALWSLQIVWIGARVIWLAVLGAGFWLLGRFLKTKNEASAATVWTHAAFWSALWLGLALLMAKIGAGSPLAGADGETGLPGAQSGLWGAGFWGLVGATVVGAPVGVWLARWRGAQGAQRGAAKAGLNGWRSLYIAVFAVLLFCTVALCAAISAASADVGLYWLAWSACAFITLGLAARARGADDFTRAARVVWSGAAVVALGAVAWAAKVEQWSWVSNDFAVVMLLLALALTLGVVGFAVSAKTQIHFSRRDLATGARVMGGLALALSLFYLVASLALLPVKAEMSRRVDDYIAQGEIAWLRAQP